MLTDAEIADLEAKAKTATPGPWTDDSNKEGHLQGAINAGQRHIAMCGWYVSKHEERTVTLKEMFANADYISAANPAVVLQLIKTVRDYRDAVEFEAKVAAMLLAVDREDVPCAHSQGTFCPRKGGAFSNCGDWCRLRMARLAVEREMETEA